MSKDWEGPPGEKPRRPGGIGSKQDEGKYQGEDVQGWSERDGGIQGGGCLQSEVNQGGGLPRPYISGNVGAGQAPALVNLAL